MELFSKFLLVCAVASHVAAQASWYYENWCGGSLQYLDDSKCAKIFPKSIDREWTCPTATLSSVPAGYHQDGSYSAISVNTSLSSYISDAAVNLCVILTKRVNQNGKTTLYNKYLCNGDTSVNEYYETWSRLRTSESTCEQDTFGLDAATTGKHGTTKFGDLATVVCSYDHTAGYTSNSLSSFFHDNGWRDRIHNLVAGSWLGAKNQTLGGNYGESTPSDLGFTATAASGEQCVVDKDPWPTVYSNTLSALSQAEMTRRLVMHRDVEESLRFPGLTWADAKEILYGAEDSLLFPGEQWGGMTVDIAVFLQQALNLSTLLEKVDTRDSWRIFSKLGAGYSTSRNRGEIVTNAHACIPSFDSDGHVIDTLEMTIHGRGSIPYDSGLTKAQQQLYTAVSEAVDYVMTHEVNLF